VKYRISSSRPSSSGHDRSRLISALEKNLVDIPTPPAPNDQRRAHLHEGLPPPTAGPLPDIHTLDDYLDDLTRTNTAKSVVFSASATGRP
jgi:hypothetical protein